MSLTEVLLKTISTFATQRKETTMAPEAFMESYLFAKKNRILLLFLENNKSNQSAELLKEEIQKYNAMLTSVSMVSDNLSRGGVNYAIHKTIRPYRSATVDIDIIVFGDKKDHRRSFEILNKKGYQLLVHGPQSSTVMDTGAKIGIDLYKEIAVSNIVYLDKNKLADCTMMLTLPNGSQIKNLKPEADLLCIIAHSIIKEQMYVLSEYYTFLSYLRQMNVNNFLALVKQNNLTIPARTHANITALLCKMANGPIPSRLQEIITQLGTESLETTRMIRRNYAMPHKYHPITVARALLEIAKAPITRTSMAQQMARMVDPGFSKTFLKALIEHTARQTY